MSKEAMKLAQKWQQTDWNTESPMSADFAVSEANDVINALMDALREALAEQPAQQRTEELLEIFKDVDQCGPLLGMGQPAQQEPVNEGWKLVPVEPTEDMWKAVNKLDDEMAAGSYDGTGCSIEQAWHCLLDAAPTPPAQRTWVGLSADDKETPDMGKYVFLNDDWIDGYKTGMEKAEAKLKEKNT